MESVERPLKHTVDCEFFTIPRPKAIDIPDQGSTAEGSIYL